MNPDTFLTEIHRQQQPSPPLLWPPLPSLSQAGGVQLRGALAAQRGPGVSQHPAMAQRPAPLRGRAGQQHPPSTAAHQVLRHCLQVLLGVIFILLIVIININNEDDVQFCFNFSRTNVFRCIPALLQEYGKH